jgi:hypothetical protein
MFYRITFLLIIFGFAVFTVGCHILLAEQEWSENYALLEGVNASSPQMIDGNLNTVGETETIGHRHIYGSSWGSAVSIKLPEKKDIRRIVIHSENIKKLNIYADKGGTALSETDWHLIKEIKSVKSNPIVISLSYTFPTDHLRIVVTDLTDEAANRRKEKAAYYQGTTPMESELYGFVGSRRFYSSYQARISEIEIYGYKSAEETATVKSDTQLKDEINTILE